MKTNLLDENVVNAQFSHVTRYKISYVFYIFLNKNLNIRFSDHFLVWPEAESAYSMTSLTISD